MSQRNAGLAIFDGLDRAKVPDQGCLGGEPVGPAVDGGGLF
jgi:hypothetical protein